MPQSTVILYLIATPQDYPNLKGRALLYTIRGTVYSSPLDAEGQLAVGAPIQVYAEDADELIEKSKFQTKKREPRYAFTRSASEAALRKEAWLKGEAYTPSGSQEYTVTPDVIMLQAQTLLTTDQLKQLLKQREPDAVVEPVAQPPQRTRKSPVQPPPVTAERDDEE